VIDIGDISLSIESVSSVLDGIKQFTIGGSMTGQNQFNFKMVEGKMLMLHIHS
jgi:hypothetical protein